MNKMNNSDISLLSAATTWCLLFFYLLFRSTHACRRVVIFEIIEVEAVLSISVQSMWIWRPDQEAQLLYRLICRLTLESYNLLASWNGLLDPLAVLETAPLDAQNVLTFLVEKLQCAKHFLVCYINHYLRDRPIGIYPFRDQFRYILILSFE